MLVGWFIPVGFILFDAVNDSMGDIPEVPPTSAAKDYPCQFCGKTHKSRQARWAHEKVCTSKPTETPKDPTPTGSNDLSENRRIFEQDMGIDIPYDRDDEPEDEPEDDTGPAFDPLVAIVGILILIVVGAIICRDRIMALFRGRRPPGRVVSA